MLSMLFFFFFFFQAEDGIRDLTVTGVQTCALPISIRIVAIVHRRHSLMRDTPVISGGWGSPINIKIVGAMSDRKSTRLNSSHSQISYAVFCLKKKKNNT